MESILIFMSKNPILSFLIALIISQCIVRVVKQLAYAIRGPQPICPKCGYPNNEDDDDDDDD